MGKEVEPLKYHAYLKERGVPFMEGHFHPVHPILAIKEQGVRNIDLTLVYLLQAIEGTKISGLPCARRADDTYHFLLGYLKGNCFEDLHLPEGLAYPHGLDHVIFLL
jgi:hypothetical protein